MKIKITILNKLKYLENLILKIVKFLTKYQFYKRFIILFLITKDNIVT